MLKTLTLSLALAGVFAATGAVTADAKMRKGRMLPTASASAFVGQSCEALREMAARQDRRGENYYMIQYIQCLNR
jgi:ADP-dependent phosphofructokinase/glucokinase